MDVDASERGAEATDSPFPRCSVCGAPIAIATVTDPLEAVASPCGCRVSPTGLEFEE